MGTVGELSNMTPNAALVATAAAGFCVSLFTYLGLPVSASQAIIGAVLGIGMISGIPDFTKLYKVVVCWVLTPIGGMVLSYFMYPIFGRIFQGVLQNLILRSHFIRASLVFAGCYGAYSLGANNVANVTGVYVGSGMLSPFEAALIGSLSIAFGVLTYSRKVMMTVGKKIVELDGFSAFISTFASAITVHIFTQVGVPVSTSQAVVGGVTGIGLVKGSKTIRTRTLVEIAIGWVTTPIASGFLAYLLMRVSLMFGG
jgi:PiT family inorganic phosphate transporter